MSDSEKYITRLSEIQGVNLMYSGREKVGMTNGAAPYIAHTDGVVNIIGWKIDAVKQWYISYRCQPGLVTMQNLIGNVYNNYQRQ